MSARAWFTPANSEGLTPEDCAVLNRAVRQDFPSYGPPPRPLHLMSYRLAYKPGMSADDLCAHRADEQRPPGAPSRFRTEG